VQERVSPPALEPARRARVLRTAASTFSVAVLLFGLLNLAALLDLRFHNQGRLTRQLRRFGEARVRQAHPEIPPRDFDAFRREVDAQRLEYEPFTESRPVPVHGRFVNVSPVGFREVKNQRPWPPPADAVDIFVFGGSTTYGLSLDDTQTIPSHLQEIAEAAWKRKVAVYGFGRPGHFSSQERILFEQLLAAGHRPEIAVFVDGVNEWRNVDLSKHDYLWHGDWTNSLRGLANDLEGATVTGQLTAFARALPLFHWILRRGSLGPAFFEMPGGEQGAILCVDRWLVNRRVIAATARELGVRTLFVWQPVSTYGYDLAHHLFRDDDLPQRAPLGYAEMAKRRAAGQLGPDVLWLADLQRGRTENLYVDNGHYTAAFSRAIAAEIVRALPAPSPAQRGTDISR
jgi:hypothetical protein